jgi:hypothetical protein
MRVAAAASPMKTAKMGSATFEIRYAGAAADILRVVGRSSWQGAELILS